MASGYPSERALFLLIPFDLRLRIIHECLSPSQIPQVRTAFRYDLFPRFTALTRVCCQLRQEALPIFYDFNTLHFEAFVSANYGDLERTPYVWLIDDRDNKHAIPSPLQSLFPIPRAMRQHVRHLQLRVDCSAFALGVGNDLGQVPARVDFLQPLSRLDVLGFTGLETLRLIMCDAIHLEGTRKRYTSHTRAYREGHKLPKGVFKIEYGASQPWSLEGPVRHHTQ